MKVVRAVVISVVVVLLAVALWSFAGTSTAKGQTEQVIPKSYGALKGSIGLNYLVFEDSAGTIRLVQVQVPGSLGTFVRR